jgi:ABC-2 type transport system ATP-binding protein
MNVLFSSHLLPDVEFVCDHVVVLGQGRLLAQGSIQELKYQHDHCYEVRVKADAGAFARRLAEAGCTVNEQDHGLLVRLPAGQSERLLWTIAAAEGEQIRHLRPQRSTLEEVFLKALE